MNSFLKWPGGKQWFVGRYKNFFPANINRYIEPFVGGGAVFFHLLPERATIADVNPDLINTYVVMRNNPIELAEILIRHQDHHDKEYYYEIRQTAMDNDIERAGKFLYLNRACFNGMYRVNQNGMFNVPIGSKSNFIFDLNKFNDYSQALLRAHIVVSDFGAIIREANAGDLIFVDPPYTIAHSQDKFIKYNERLFTWSDQERLVDELAAARDRGTRVLATNANYQMLREMYIDHGFFTKIVERYSSISGRADRRSIQEELIISSVQI